MLQCSFSLTQNQNPPNADKASILSAHYKHNAPVTNDYGGVHTVFSVLCCTASERQIATFLPYPTTTILTLAFPPKVSL